MSRVVLLGADGLVAQELLIALDDHPLGGDLKLLSLEEEKIGQLTEAAGAAALIGRADAPAVAAADTLVVLGEIEPYRELLAERREGASVVLAGSDASPADGTPVVVGVNSQAAGAGEVLVSPDPGVILLAHLLAPLREDGTGGRLRSAAATLVQPASVFDRPGLDELFSQAGRMVSMQSQAPSALFGDRQLAFNLYPALLAPQHLQVDLATVLGTDLEDDPPPIAAHVLQGPVFHGYSALVHVRLEGPNDPESLTARLAASAFIEPLSADAGQPAPTDVAGADDILLGTVYPSGHPDGGDGYWLWAVMDNLTRGGALNVLGILEAALAGDD